MPAQKDGLVQPPLLRAFAPLHKTALGVACGVVLGGLVSIVTLATVILGPYPSPIWLMSQFLWGYSISWVGVFVGLLWGFGLGFLLGWGFALTRNVVVWIWLTVIRSRAEMEQYSDFLDHL